MAATRQGRGKRQLLDENDVWLTQPGRWTCSLGRPSWCPRHLREQYPFFCSRKKSAKNQWISWHCPCKGRCWSKKTTLQACARTFAGAFRSISSITNSTMTTVGPKHICAYTIHITSVWRKRAFVYIWRKAGEKTWLLKKWKLENLVLLSTTTSQQPKLLSGS